MSAFQQTWEHNRHRVERAIELRLPGSGSVPDLLHQAMRYACLGSGKRFRAMLVYAAGAKFGATDEILDDAAAAVELVHAYSLIHDDLPAMDDDDLRRGRPSCHKAFDEATAILAGDASQSLAFELLSRPANDSKLANRRLRMVRILAESIGPGGMAGGQCLDMQATGMQISIEELNTLHLLKTGALIRASCVLGGLAAENTTDSELKALANFGEAIGLAFQIKDDILDVTQKSEILGKSSGSDAKQSKSTYISIFGLDGAEQQCELQYQSALESARRLGDNTELFQQLAEFVVKRQY